MNNLLLSAEETFLFGEQFGRSLTSGSVVALFGPLGSGKTTFMKGLVASAANWNPANVSSPTFQYLHIYEGKETVYHFDLYRLQDEQSFVDQGFEEFLHLEGGICCIEWAERIESLLPKSTQRLAFSYCEEYRKVQAI